MKVESKKMIVPILLGLVFWSLGLFFSYVKGTWFFVFDLGYIGTSLALGLGLYAILPKAKKIAARRLPQFLVGSYMLGFLGLFWSVNMQLEGFFFNMLAGLYTGAVIHYSIAKIFGPLLFGRGFCGWACWTAAVLDFLPFTRSEGRLPGYWGALRYLHFVLSFALVLAVWYGFGYSGSIYHRSTLELQWLLAGNAMYYVVGIGLAFWLKDNRAFCKYVCPITVFLKGLAHFAIIRIKGDAAKCNSCGACGRVCPMDIRVHDYVRNGTRVMSTECILCQTCINTCPQGILTTSFGCDACARELLRIRDVANAPEVNNKS